MYKEESVPGTSQTRVLERSQQITKKSYATCIGRMWYKTDDLPVYLERGSTTGISGFHQCQVRNRAQELP